MNIVYFLGAGASKNFGYPLTGEIMPEIMAELTSNHLFKSAATQTTKEDEGENRLLAYIYTLYPGLKGVDSTTNKERIPNITEILSLVDHCCFYGIPPHPKLSDGKLEDFRQLLNRAIGELLYKYELMPYTDEERTMLDNFIKPVKLLGETESITFITTNYDLILDNEFMKETLSNTVDFGITYRNVADSNLVPMPLKPVLKYYKLHGSLNWIRCSLCGHYYINPFGSIVHMAFKEHMDDANTCVCSDELRLKAVLVSPSLVRDIRDSNLLQIWKAALEAIRNADRLIFIGYSLPPEDLAIKSIIMRGLNGRNKKLPPAIDIVQYGDAAKNNYLNLFGNDVQYFSKGLQEYMQAKNGMPKNFIQQ